MMVQSELEEMLNYSQERSEITPHSLFFNFNQMMKSLELIFGKLSELDYIGKKKHHRQRAGSYF